MPSPTDTRAATAKRRRGDAVEQLARDLLYSHGLQDVARNAGYRVGELDLVMRDGTTLVFVEVRYRRNAGYGGGAESIDARKRLRLVRAAQVFLSRHPRWMAAPCRFDVVEASGEPPRLQWIRDAFRADD